MVKSVYIHIPFCKNICAYCDFAKVYYNKDLALKYLEALEEEIKEVYQNEKIKTIYIGGGTPSILESEIKDKLFSITNKFNLDKNYEFTFECNIEDINEDMLKKLKTNKVNRLSIGVQSFNKKILKTLGREYNEIDKILLAKKYFKNINCDLIYGVKTQTLEELRNDLKTFLKLSIPHLSIYSLILEEHTKLFLGNYQEIDEDLNSDMYNLICKTLKENGYEHYEISNFAKKGYQSKHNLVYWNNEEYFGFGVGASGYINNIRYTNTRSIANYINKKRIVFKENIDLKKAMEYEMILGLRKIKGVNKLKFKEKYNKELKDIFFVGNLKSKGNYYFIPYDKLFVSNSILCDFILD